MGAQIDVRERDAAAASWGLEAGEELAPGRTVVRALGGGRRYEALLVWDERLYALAVAKVLRPRYVEHDGALADLRREADALDRLTHPTIVRAFDAVVDGPRPHLLLEHLEGPSLGGLIRAQGTVALEQLLPLAAHVAAALHYMAGEQMTHLDVKPDNVVMGIPPRLIDFSIARTVDDAAFLRAAVGTDAYMAPEQCLPGRPPRQVGPATDAWGLGATLHHAVSGAPPFRRAPDASESRDPLTRFPQLHADPRPLPRHLPAPLRATVERCLTWAPADRPEASEVIAALEPLVGESARGGGAVRRVRRR